MAWGVFHSCVEEGKALCHKRRVLFCHTIVSASCRRAQGLQFFSAGFIPGMLPHHGDVQLTVDLQVVVALNESLHSFGHSSRSWAKRAGSLITPAAVLTRAHPTAHIIVSIQTSNGSHGLFSGLRYSTRV